MERVAKIVGLRWRKSLSFDRSTRASDGHKDML
jgi:hypothetical protein